MQTYQERVINEKKELDEKIVSLGIFVTGALYKSLSVDEQDRLTRQSIAMETYSSILRERIAAF